MEVFFPETSGNKIKECERKNDKLWHLCDVSFLNHQILVNLKNSKQKPEKSLFLSKPLLLLGADASGVAALRDCSTCLDFGG